MTDLEAVRQEGLASFSVERIPMSDAVGWELIDGSIQHRTRGFFSVVGVDLGENLRQVLLYQPQAAVTGLLTTICGGERYVLIQARAEPGCVNAVQFGPTIQSTPANFLALHGGAPSPYAAVLLAAYSGLTLLSDTTQSDLGGRYLMKSKRAVTAFCEPSMPVAPGFVWASVELLRRAVCESTFLNIDLRALLSMLPWGEQGGISVIGPRGTAACRSLCAPIRPQVLGRLVGCTQQRTHYPRLVPLDSLPGWTLSEWGLEERLPVQRFGVNFYQVTASLREVASWSQPLVSTTTEGCCELACRERDGILEVLLRVIREAGLATGWGLAPTVLRYPGHRDQPDCWLGGVPGRDLVATVESDEGGRFFRHVSRYALVLMEGSCEDPAEADPDLSWVTLSELKACLAMSNLCTIQLRGIASHLLAL